MGLHQRYATILGNKTLTLAAPIKDELREELRKKFAKMMSALFKQKGANFDINIIASDEAQDFINTHTSVLDSSFQKVEMSDLMRQRLTRSNYIFSGLKTFHELNEAFPSLLDENGNKKTFERFLNDVRKIDETYNSNYLRAEYNFVQASAEMAAKWEKFMEDGDHYYLQYRTQHDDKVRPEHASLDRVTLPPTDSFWESYYPPNGWNCRCTVVQVLKRKYEPTPHDTTLTPSSDVVTVILQKVSWILTESLLQIMNFVLLAAWYINAPIRTLIQEKQICLLKTVMRYLQSLWMNNISPNT